MNIYDVIRIGILVLNVILVAWVVSDARKQKVNAPLWGLIVFLTGPVGWIVYLVARPRKANQFHAGTPVQAAQQGVPTGPIAIPTARTAFKFKNPVALVIFLLVWLAFPFLFIWILIAHREFWMRDIGSTILGCFFILLGCGWAVGGVQGAASRNKKTIYTCPICDHVLFEYFGVGEAERASIGENCPRCGVEFWAPQHKRCERQDRTNP
jgi:hypothetical protein